MPRFKQLTTDEVLSLSDKFSDCAALGRDPGEAEEWERSQLVPVVVTRLQADQLAVALYELNFLRRHIRADLEAEKAHDANRREPVAPKDPAPQGADLPDSLALAGALGDPLPHPEACRGLFPRPGCGLCAWLVSKGLTVLA